MKKISLLLSALALIAVVTVSSCSKSNNGPSTIAHVMFYNGCVGVSGDGSLLASVNNVTEENGTHILYNSFLTGGYQNVTAGNAVDFTFTNASLGSSLTGGVSEAITANTYYTVFAGGSVAAPYVFMTTDVFPTPAAGMASVRVVNLSPYSDSTTISPGTSGGSVSLGTNIHAGVCTSFISIAAGTYNFFANPNPNVGIPNPEVGSYMINAGKSYTLIFSGIRTGSGALTYTLTPVQNN